MIPDETPLDRIDELLADRALDGLDPVEAEELARLVADPDAAGLALELAAAEAALALGGLDAELPPSLRDRVEADADRFFRPTRERPRIVATLPWLGWAVAAGLLVASFLERPAQRPDPPRTPVNLARRPLARTDHPLARGGRGELAWSGSGSEGYLDVQGLAETEPGRGVYQVWIFDATRDERFPVDGGTFAIQDSGSTTRVPIRPRLPIRRPTLLAVTLEPPGGVVVSDRKRILLTATFPPEAADPVERGDGAAFSP